MFTCKKATLALILMVYMTMQPLAVFAQSASLSAGRLDEIRKRCSSAQISLQQLQKRDAVSRINRGRAYDQLMLQISAMNSRLAYNNVSIPALVTISKDLQAHIDQFRLIADKQYFEHLVNAIKINCKEKPVEFYDQIVLTREDRDRLVGEVDSIDQLIAQYRNEIARHRATLPETAAKGTAQ